MNQTRYQRNGMDDGWLYVQSRGISMLPTGGDTHKRRVQTMTNAESRYLVFVVGRAFHSTRMGWPTLKDAADAADRMAMRCVGIYDQRKNQWHDYVPKKGEA